MTNLNSGLFNQLLSYLALRKIIGFVGFMLPFVLATGKVLFDSPGIYPSVSEYYYSTMRDVFVGSLCIIGIFLMFYRGYDNKDNIVCTLAGFFAICVALFPTTLDCSTLTTIYCDLPTPKYQVTGIVHLTSAALFFILISYISIALFTKSSEHQPMTDQKKKRNIIYLSCGFTILISLSLIAFFKVFFEDTSLSKIQPVFILETVAIIAFSIAWIIKGETFLKDK